MTAAGGVDVCVAVLEKVNRLPKPSLAPSRGCVRARRGVPCASVPRTAPWPKPLLIAAGSHTSEYRPGG